MNHKLETFWHLGQWLSDVIIEYISFTLEDNENQEFLNQHVDIFESKFQT